MAIKTLKFTRQQVIKALLTERLIKGEYVEHPDLDKVGKCRVCAIGAVLRSAQLTNTEIDSAGCSFMGGEGGKLLRTLEREFEYSERYTYDGETKPTGFFSPAGYPTKKLREHLVAFVTKTFPAKFTVRARISWV